MCFSPHIGAQNVKQLQQTTSLSAPAAFETPVATHLEDASTVTFEDGALAISARSSKLGDILRKIQSVTGAEIDGSIEAEELVAAQVGPGPARDVISAFLVGSRFNYILVGSSEDSNVITKVILSPKQDLKAAPETQASSPWRQPAPGQAISERQETALDTITDTLSPVRAQQQMLMERRRSILQGIQVSGSK
jgi:hypothetical protein